MQSSTWSRRLLANVESSHGLISPWETPQCQIRAVENHRSRKYGSEEIFGES